MAKDVMEVLKSMAACYETERQSADGWRAFEALSELIAADVEYDEAWKAMCYDQGSGTENRFAEAKKRRAAALSACRGL